MSKDTRLNIASVAGAAFLTVCGGYVLYSNKIEAEAKDKLQRISKQVAESDRQERDRKNQEEAYANAMRNVQEEERQRVRTDALLKQEKKMREFYGIYQMIVNELKTLNTERSLGKTSAFEYQVWMEAHMANWSKVDSRIREYNRGVGEEYYIDLLDCPITSR